MASDVCCFKWSRTSCRCTLYLFFFVRISSPLNVPIARITPILYGYTMDLRSTVRGSNHQFWSGHRAEHPDISDESSCGIISAAASIGIHSHFPGKSSLLGCSSCLKVHRQDSKANPSQSWISMDHVAPPLSIRSLSSTPITL